jgi:hypothetical protein
VAEAVKERGDDGYQRKDANNKVCKRPGTEPSLKVTELRLMERRERSGTGIQRRRGISASCVCVPHCRSTPPGVPNVNETQGSIHRHGKPVSAFGTAWADANAHQAWG